MRSRPISRRCIPIFNAGRLAVVLNVGTLVQPTSKTNYTSKSVPLPPKLF